MLPEAGAVDEVVRENRTLRIGQLASLASVSVETLRYYERQGLLEKPYQHLSRYRAYPVAAVAHVQSIKRAQALGFSLAEIRNLLKGARGERFSSQASKKLAEVDGMLLELQRARGDLVRLVEYGCDGLVGCSCGHADCPTNVGQAVVSPTTATDPRLAAAPGKPPGLFAGALLAAGCAACCAPLVGAALAAAGVPALAATEGLEVGLGATALAAAGIVVNRLRRRRTPIEAFSAAGDVSVACSLSAADLGDREAEWRALLDTSLLEGEPIPSGVRITVQPGAAGELNRLVDLERDCCAWMSFEFDGAATVAITAPGEGGAVLAAMFLD